MPVTHIAGLDVALGGRYLRQRCAWCDEVLIDEDATLVMVASTDPSPGGLTAWPVGQLVRVDGPVRSLLPEGEELPEDFCGITVFATPEDAVAKGADGG